MKKIVKGVILVLLLLQILGCEENAKEDLVEIDFTDGNYSPGIDYFVGITVQPEPYIIAVSRKVLRDKHLEVNGLPIDLNWVLVRDIVGDQVNYGDYYWFGFSWQEDIPSELELIEGDAVNISFQANDFSYQRDIVIPSQPLANFPQLDFTQDYSFTWSLADSVNTQLISLEFGNNDLMLVQRKQWSLVADRRDFTISQSFFHAAEIFEVQEYQVNLENINYLHNQRFLFFSSSEAGLYWQADEEQSRKKDLRQLLPKIIKLLN